MPDGRRQGVVRDWGPAFPHDPQQSTYLHYEWALNAEGGGSRVGVGVERERDLRGKFEQKSERGY